MTKESFPVAVTGPGSQPENPDGLNMAFMQMPQNMTIYRAPVIPEAEEIEGLDEALALTRTLLDSLKNYRLGALDKSLSLRGLDEKCTDFFDQLLGNGEVSIQLMGSPSIEIQESVLAGLWRMQVLDEDKNIVDDRLEVGAIPSVVLEKTFSNSHKALELNSLTVPDECYNAPPILAEIDEVLSDRVNHDDPYVINLSLLPHNESDLFYLAEVLGVGITIILSRGYGNCRISSTQTDGVWWVQYFNSQDTLILNTIEISRIPEVALASVDDIEDSAVRLEEILAIYEGEDGSV